MPGSGTSFRVDRLQRKLLTQDFGCAAGVAHIALDLLDALSKTCEEAGQGAITRWIAWRQNIQAHTVCEFNLEFLCILFCRNFGQGWLPARRTNFLKTYGCDRYSHSE